MNVDRGYLALAAKYVRRQAKQLSEQCRGIETGDDIEYVHRARVATRRLRAALRLFSDCFGSGTGRRWRRALRRLARRLGDARDLDVQIEFLSATLARQNDPQVCLALSRLAADCQSRRDQMQPRIRRAVAQLQRSGILAEMQAATKRILGKINAETVDVASVRSCRRTAKQIRRALNEVLSFQDSLDDAEDAQRHHDMRIAAKRLRYLLEISQPVYRKQLGLLIEMVKELQTYLGDIHDCDVWLGIVEQFAERTRRAIVRAYGHERPFLSVEPGLQWLRNERRAVRGQLFASLRQFWSDLVEQRVWSELAQIVEQAVETGAPPVAHALLLAPTEAEPADANADAAPPHPEAADDAARAAYNGNHGFSPKKGEQALPPWPCRRAGRATRQPLSR